MSVRYFSRRSSLSKLIRKPGGVKVGEALDQAALNLVSIRDSCVLEVDKSIAIIEKLFETVQTRPDQAAVDQAYVSSNEIAGMAGTCGLEALGHAAFSLCELLDRSGTAWFPEAITVHLNSIRLLRRLGDAGGNAETQILEGLRKVTTRATSGPAKEDAA